MLVSPQSSGCSDVYVLCAVSSGFVSIRDSGEDTKVRMDPTRDASKPFVGLAFKLEVSVEMLFSDMRDYLSSQLYLQS